MEYKKITKDNYNLHFINTNRFKTITIEINFTEDLVEEHISYYRLLSRLMAYSNKKYNTRKKMAIRLEELYNSSIFSSFNVIGSLENYLLGAEFINPKYTEESELKNNLDLLFTTLLKPNVKNEEFDSNIFNEIKDNSLLNIRLRNEYPSSIAYRNFEKIMFEDSPASYDRSGDESILSSLTSKDLYTFYKRLYKLHAINILVYGELTKEYEEYITKYIDSNMKDFSSIPSNELNPFIKRKIKITKKEKKNVSQSYLIVGYDIDGLDKKKYDNALTLYNMILGSSSNSLLFMKVREEKSYCYSINSGLYKYSNALVITAGINRKNYDDSIKTIKECIKLMNDKNVILENLDKVKKIMNTRLNNYYDSRSSISDHYFMNEFDTEDDIETQREKFNNVTVDEIMDINKYLKLNTIYFLEGVSEHE